MAFPFWEAALSVGLGVGLIGHARAHWREGGRWLKPLAGAAYGVRLLHVFIVAGLNLAFLGVSAPPFAKFLAVTALALSLSFAASMALKRVPLVAQAL